MQSEVARLCCSSAWEISLRLKGLGVIGVVVKEGFYEG